MRCACRVKLRLMRLALCATLFFGSGMSAIPSTVGDQQPPAARKSRDASEKEGFRSGKLPIIEVFGCLTLGANDSWTLTKAGRPEALVAPSTGANGTKAAPLGDRTFRLLGIGVFKPEGHKDHKIRVQGLLVDQRINVTSLQMVSEDCTK